MPLLRARDDTLVVPVNAVAAVVHDVYSWAPAETGGILMGSSASAGRAVEVCWLLGGGPEADRNGTSFEPDQGWQEEQVARIYQQSGRRAIYLGDWHSHPDGSPHLSLQDKKVARLISRSESARCEHPIMWIIGARSQRVEWQAYRLRGRRFEKVQTRLTSWSSAAVDLGARQGAD